MGDIFNIKHSITLKCHKCRLMTCIGYKNSQCKEILEQVCIALIKASVATERKYFIVIFKMSQSCLLNLTTKAEEGDIRWEADLGHDHLSY